MGERVCPQCGVGLAVGRGSRRPAIYCSARCRRLAFEARRAATASGVPVQVVIRPAEIRTVERVVWRKPEQGDLVAMLEQSPDLAGVVLRQILSALSRGQLSDHAAAAVGKHVLWFVRVLHTAGFTTWRHHPLTPVVEQLSDDDKAMLRASIS